MANLSALQGLDQHTLEALAKMQASFEQAGSLAMQRAQSKNNRLTDMDAMRIAQTRIAEARKNMMDQGNQMARNPMSAGNPSRSPYMDALSQLQDYGGMAQYGGVRPTTMTGAGSMYGTPRAAAFTAPGSVYNVPMTERNMRHDAIYMDDGTHQMAQAGRDAIHGIGAGVRGAGNFVNDWILDPKIGKWAMDLFGG